jgi:hypothetical protein
VIETFWAFGGGKIDDVRVFFFGFDVAFRTENTDVGNPMMKSFADVLVTFGYVELNLSTQLAAEQFDQWLKSG